MSEITRSLLEAFMFTNKIALFARLLQMQREDNAFDLSVVCY